MTSIALKKIMTRTLIKVRSLCRAPSPNGCNSKPQSHRSKRPVSTDIEQVLGASNAESCVESSASNATEHRYYSGKVEIVGIATTIATQ
jgi:hypothetical protein